MAGFQSFSRNSRLNNLALLKSLSGVESPAPVTQNVSGNTFRATYTSPGTFEVISASSFNPSKIRTLNPIKPAGSADIEILVVAGGGGGSFGGGGGAGGGGGVVYDPSFALDNGKSGEFTISIGSGGAGQLNPHPMPQPTSPVSIPQTGVPGGDTQVYFTPDGPLPGSGGAWGLRAKGGGGAVGQQFQFVAQPHQFVGVLGVLCPLAEQLLSIHDQVHAFGQEYGQNVRIRAGAVAALQLIALLIQ